MRVLHLVQHLDVGGAERVVISLVRHALADGHQCAVAAAPGRWSGEIDVPMFDLPMVDRRIARLLPAVRAARKAIRAWQPDIVHCHNPGMALVGALALGRSRRPVALMTMQDTRVSRVLRWTRMPIVACGPGVAAILKNAGIESVTINNAILSPRPPTADGTQPPATPPPDQRHARDYFDSILSARSKNRKVILAASRLVPAKNVQLSIRAMAHMPDAVLVIAGDGPCSDQLRREAKAAQVDDRVVFAGMRRDIADLVRAADAVVITSKLEGLPLTALETLAAGTPLVACRGDWQGNLFVDGVNCLLVPQDDPLALAGALQRASNDQELRGKLAEEGRRLAARHSDREMARRYLDFYRELLAR